MLVLTIFFVLVAILSAGATNAIVQGRLLAQGGRWLPSTITSGLCGLAVMIGVLAAYFGIGSIVVRIVG